jgi:hypothetical protein
LVERRFSRTRSRWPREVDRDWGGVAEEKFGGEAADFDVSAADVSMKGH